MDDNKYECAGCGAIYSAPLESPCTDGDGHVSYGGCTGCGDIVYLESDLKQDGEAARAKLY